MDEDIREITRSIWETLFTAPLASSVAVEELSDPVVTGCVHIVGAWDGAVLLQCGEELAMRLAAELFRSPVPSADDVRDTVGELTNMLAGNIKAVLPEPARISLPTVSFGSDHDLSVMGAAALAVVPFRCGGSPLVVTLLQSVGDGAS